MMRSAAIRLSWLALLGGFVCGCAAPRDRAGWATVREVTPPFLTRLGGSDATLAADAHGRVALTYVTRDSTGKNLWLSMSRDSGLTFGAPARVNLATGRVDSYPEGRPLVVFGPAGELAIAWSERRADTSQAVDLVVRASGDGGATLGPAAIVNDDRALPPADASAAPASFPGARSLSPARGHSGTRLASVRRDGAIHRGWAARHPVPPAPDPNRGYHAFPALTFLPDGSLFATWLDGREDASGEEEPPYAALYSALSRDGGQSWNPNVRLADSVCACCRPTAASDAAGRIAIAYRSARSDFRDPALAVSFDRGATTALDTVVSADRWLLNACPAQGPVLTWNRPSGGMLAWYTGAQPAGVYLLPWQADHGAAGVKRPLADSLLSARSPRFAAWDRATFVGVEARPREDSTRTVFAVRALDPDGSMTPWTFLGSGVRAGWLAATDARSTLACWTEKDGERTRVRIARIRWRAGVR